MAQEMFIFADFLFFTDYLSHFQLYSHIRNKDRKNVNGGQKNCPGNLVLAEQQVVGFLGFLIIFIYLRHGAADNPNLEQSRVVF